MLLFLSVLIGFSSGFSVSAGVFALVTALSLLPRMADKTHTATYMKTYENCVFWGALAGISIYFLQIYEKHIALTNSILLFFVLAFCGFFQGIAIGTLALSLAENLDVTAVLGRRAKLHYGLGFLILSFAIGKFLGSFLFFLKRWF